MFFRIADPLIGQIQFKFRLAYRQRIARNNVIERIEYFRGIVAAAFLIQNRFGVS
ncbi:MAG: hypothetical protein ACREVO_11195 [Steroidobacteraceae bacterium]